MNSRKLRHKSAAAAATAPDRGNHRAKGHDPDKLYPRLNLTNHTGYHA